jgi:hypothetical protein
MSPNERFESLRPWPLAAASVGVLMVASWYDMAGLEYRDKAQGSPLTTAGWFVMGFPMLVGFGLLFACLVTWFARKVSPWAAWPLLLLLSFYWLHWEIAKAQPTARLSRIIGPDAAAMATIHRLRQRDSFGDGTFTEGIISGPAGLLPEIVRYRSLEPSSMAPLHRFEAQEQGYPPMPGPNVLPDYGDVVGDERARFYLHPPSGKIYFYYESNSDRPRKR